MSENILVIGAILLDTKGKPHAGLEPGTSNPAGIRSTRGGTARNVAENLALLGADVTLLSAVGNDVTGKRLLIQTADSGVNLDYTLIIEGENTGAYIAILDPDGSLSVALDDVDVMRHITPEYLYEQESLFAQAGMVVMDGSLTQEAMETVIQLALQYERPLSVPTHPRHGWLINYGRFSPTYISSSPTKLKPLNCVKQIMGLMILISA